MSTSILACPSCRTPVAVQTDALVCGSCGQSYPNHRGIYRFLRGANVAVERFHRQYRDVRAHDGSHHRSIEAVRQLPDVAADDPRAGEWAIRKESFERLRTVLRRASRRGTLRVADLGAGNGWLSYRLRHSGAEVYAVDRLDDDADGLGACATCDRSIVCVQADFDALPFVDAAFDAVVLNGSLHYSPEPAATLAEAHRVLAPGGALVVMDSPMFKRLRDGEAMVLSQMRKIVEEVHIDDPVRPGVGFLTFEALNTAARRLGLQARFMPSRGSLGWRLRREIGRLRLRRAPAAFGVWVAQ